ncbi:MAG TPA: translocation/assembly module TamB domain-containing protein [Candidatus Krumholzibacteria bacterium]|nr:translocation/assembly module TamB domain-containing protein [Candidatus Krumholzibacteria bacterium]
MTETASNEKTRARLRRRISYGVAVVLTAVILVVIHRQSQLLPGRVAEYVNTHYLAGSPFVFSIDGISGSLVHTIVLENPVLRYDSPSASYNVFRADRVSVTYELMPVFAFRLVVHEVELDGVAIHLRQDEQGRLVLPVPQNESPAPRKRGVVSPVVDVRNFRINGLEMTFGGNRTQLGVRDVHLAGSCGYKLGEGSLTIDEGDAYLVDSRKTVSSVRLAARTDGSTLFLDDFGVRLDESFVLATGRFHHGLFEDVNVTFNPISLPELHELGIAPELEGKFAGKLALSGTVDSLEVAGSVSGTGLGVELSGVEFSGLARPSGVNFRRFRGEVFGSGVDGAFRIDLPSEDFVFDGSVSDLDLSRGFITDADLPPMSMTGRVRVEHDKSEGTYAWRGDLDRAVVDGFENFSVVGSGLWRDGTGLTINRLAFERPGYRVAGSGEVADGGDTDIVFHVDGTDLGYFWNHFKLPPIEGAVNLTGHIQGPIEDFQLNLNGSARNVAFEFMTVDSADVQAEARNVGSLAPTVTVSLSGRHGTAWERALDNPTFLLEVDTSVVRVHNARATRGDTTIVVDLDVHAQGRKSRIEIRHAEIATPLDTWRTVAPSSIYADDDGVLADSIVFASGRGQFGGAGSYSERTRTMDLTLWGRGVDLSVLRDALRAPVLLRGRGDFDLLLEGPQENPRTRLDVDVVHGAVDSVGFDELAARLSFDGSVHRLHYLQMIANGDSIVARGEWESDVSPVRLARGERPASIWDVPVSASGRLAHFPVGTFFTAMHRPAPISADFTGLVTLTGTLSDPEITTVGTSVPGAGPGRVIPPASVQVAYRGGVLDVQDVRVREVVDAHISGTFPLMISLREGAWLETEGPMTFRVDIAPVGSELSGVSRYVPAVAYLRGELSGSLTGGGTPSAPSVQGQLTLTRGELRAVGMQEQFSNLTARIDFVDDMVRLTSLNARAGDKGSVVATGWARISNYRPVDYRADLTLHEFRLKSIPDVDVLLDGTLVARLNEWREGRKLPLVTGALDVREANIYLELAAGAEEGSAFTLPTDEPGWICSVDLSAPKNVWIRNQDLNVEMAGDVILKKDERGMYFRGDMAVLRGSYRLYGNKFTITSGNMDFSAAETLRPAMLIEAYTPHRSQDGPDRNIYLTLSWPYDKKEPQISLAYDEPGYSEADIWRMLGGSMFATGFATNALERVINAQMTGFTVDVERRSIEEQSQAGNTLEQETLVGVGRYLWEDVYLQYRRGLSVGGEQEVNVEYRLSNKFLIRSQFIYNSRRNRAGIAGQDTDEFNLDLKYRFEY